MRYLIKLYIIYFILLWSDSLCGVDEYSGNRLRGDCTIGVFSGEVTSDGRPLLWKNRDVADANQRFIYVGSYLRDDIITIPYKILDQMPYHETTVNILKEFDQAWEEFIAAEKQVFTLS
jgi:hypothetical protein